MTAHEKEFIVILIVNFIVTVIYLIFNLFRKKDNRTSCWIRAIIMLLCPVTGVAVFFVGYLCYLIFFHKEVDLEDVVFSKERVEKLMHADEDRERNLVPVEEAIEVTDTGNLRTLMLNVVRGDIQQSLSTIAMALESEDSETAHYAASTLQDALNDFRLNVQKNYRYMCENEEERVEYAHTLIPYMNQVLKQHVFTDMEQKNMVGTMENICEMLYKKEPEGMMSSEFEAISMRLLEIKKYDLCKKWCDRAAEMYPNTLSTFTCQLKLYYSIGDKETFFGVLNELRKSGIPVDSETLELIRVFV